MDPGRAGQDRDVAGQGLEDGEPEALGGRREDHRVGGVDVEGHPRGLDVAEVQQRRAVGRLKGEVVALARARGVGGEEQAGRVGIQAERAAGLGAGDGPEAVRGDAAGEHRDAALAHPGGEVVGQRLRGRGEQVDAAQRGQGDRAGPGVVHVGAVQGERPRRAVERAHHPGREAEVRVDDVVAARDGGAVRAADRPGGAEVGQRGAGGEGGHVDLDAVEAPQRVDLVADEGAEGGVGRRGPHVRHDERAQGGADHPRSGTGAVTGIAPSIPGVTTPRPEGTMDHIDLQGRAHARIHHASTALARRMEHPERGQGSVEYVALIMLVGGVLAAAVALIGGEHAPFDLAKIVTDKMKKAIDSVGSAS